jgi:hypothetical protein
MAYPNQPFLNIEYSSLSVDILVFARYDSNMNVEMLPKEVEMLHTHGNVAPGNVVEDDVEDALGVNAYILKLHLTNLEK